MKGKRAYEVCVPHPDRVLDADLAHQKAVHPPETELDELHALGLHVLCQRSIDARGEIP